MQPLIFPCSSKEVLITMTLHSTQDLIRKSRSLLREFLSKHYLRYSERIRLIVSRSNVLEKQTFIAILQFYRRTMNSRPYIAYIFSS